MGLREDPATLDSIGIRLKGGWANLIENSARDADMKMTRLRMAAYFFIFVFPSGLADRSKALHERVDLKTPTMLVLFRYSKARRD